MNNKKILTVIIIFMLAFCGLGFGIFSNRQVGWDLNQKFNKALINLGNSEWELMEVTKWRDFENGDEVQFETPDGKVYLTHYSNVVLIYE